MPLDSPVIVDGLIVSDWSREVFEEMRDGGLTAANCTCAVWHNFRETMDNIAAWQGYFRDHADILAQARSVADIRAVGPGTWNAWKAALLRDLYYAAEEAITGGMAGAVGGRRIEQAKTALASALDDFEPREIEAHLERGYPAYWLSHPTETHARHARLVREAGGSETPLKIDMRTDSYRQATEATVYAPDHAGLFSNIAGAIAVSGGNIVDAKIFTMADGMALDTFWVQGRRDEPIDGPDRLARLRENIEQAVTGRMRPMREIEDMIRKEGEKRDSVFTVEPRVIIDNAASATHTVVEVNGRDRPGLLWWWWRA